VDGGEGAVPIDLGDDPWLAGVSGVHHDDVLRVDAPEAHLIGGIALCHPVPPSLDLVEDALFLEIIQQFFQILLPEALPPLEG